MGVLSGIRIIELAGIGPTPMGGMMLADMGAEVILIQRKTSNPNSANLADAASLGKHAIFNRGKKAIALDLKNPKAIDLVLDLVDHSDALIEGFRPGIMEKLGLGPDICLQRNPSLVFGRMTGWGQNGPLAHAAGHDINYIALSGALYYSGHKEETPFSPPTLVGDVGGGTMFLALGVVSALLHARATGQGQVVDVAISDCSALMNSLVQSFHSAGLWSDNRGENMLDSGAHWYDSFECKDGHYISIGSLEPKFYALLVRTLGLEDDPVFANQMDKTQWPAAKAHLKALFITKTRQEWSNVMEGTDICFAPVLNLSEAPHHPHNIARSTYVKKNGVMQAAPAPKFTRTPSEIAGPPPEVSSHIDEILTVCGYNDAAIRTLKECGAI